MDFLYEWFRQPLDTLAHAGAPKWVMLLLAFLMFGGWSSTYLAIIWKSHRDRAYGITLANTCLNFSWEAIFSFDLMGGLPEFFFPLKYGHLLWLLPNSCNVYQTWKHGPDLQSSEWMRRHFRTIFVVSFPIAFTLIYSFQQYAFDVFGVASSWMINAFMSWLFIRMLIDRRNEVAADGTIRGMSITGAYFKLLGNAAGAVFCYYWWPAQFTGGWLQHDGLLIPEPYRWTYLYVIYALNLTLDVVLIHMLSVRVREIRAGQRTMTELPVLN